MRPHRSSSPPFAAAALVFAVVATACDNDHTGPVGTGNLAVSIATPAGVLGAVQVNGPRSYQQMVATSQTLTHVPAGTFTIVADSVVTADSITGSRTDTGSAASGSVTVNRNDTGRATVTYALKRRRGVLWIANDVGGALYAYGVDSLHKDSTLTPLDTLSGGLDDPTGMAFDPSGNLWVGNQGSDTLTMFTAAQLASNGAVTPARVIIDDAFSDVEGLRFDPHGNLWVMGQASLYAFTPAQQAAGGVQDAAVTISGSLLVSPEDMLFDSTGNAWVSDFESAALIRFTAAQLSTTGTPVPVDTITSSDNSLSGPTGLAYDHSGNLWVANYEGGNVAAFSPTQQTTGGAVTPIAVVSPAGGSSPWGIEFDASGSLWVADFDAGTAYALSAAQLAASGSPMPSVVVHGVLGPSNVLLDPVTPTVAGAGHLTSRLRSLPDHSLHTHATGRPGRGVATH